MLLPVCLLAALASIGSGLSMSKEYRGVFEDLIEKVGFAGCEYVRVLTSTRDVEPSSYLTKLYVLKWALQ